MTKGVRGRDGPPSRDDRDEHNAVQFSNRQVNFRISNKALEMAFRFLGSIARLIVLAHLLSSMKGNDLATALTLLNRILKSASALG